MSSPLSFSRSATDPLGVDPPPQEWPVSPNDERTGRDAIIWEKDPRTRRFTYVSKRAESLLGYPLRRWLDESDFWLHILHSEDRERADALCRDATEHLRNHELEYRVVAADGRTHWLQDRVNVLAGPDG
ncbi:MAG: PAS domain-containing protein, partial [Longimicrobiales bacterium]